MYKILILLNKTKIKREKISLLNIKRCHACWVNGECALIISHMNTFHFSIMKSLVLARMLLLLLTRVSLIFIFPCQQFGMLNISLTFFTFQRLDLFTLESHQYHTLWTSRISTSHIDKIFKRLQILWVSKCLNSSVVVITTEIFDANS